MTAEHILRMKTVFSFHVFSVCIFVAMEMMSFVNQSFPRGQIQRISRIRHQPAEACHPTRLRPLQRWILSITNSSDEAREGSGSSIWVLITLHPCRWYPGSWTQRCSRSRWFWQNTETVVLRDDWKHHRGSAAISDTTWRNTGLHNKFYSSLMEWYVFSTRLCKSSGSLVQWHGHRLLVSLLARQLGCVRDIKFVESIPQAPRNSLGASYLDEWGEQQGQSPSTLQRPPPGEAPWRHPETNWSHVFREGDEGE